VTQPIVEPTGYVATELLEYLRRFVNPFNGDIRIVGTAPEKYGCAIDGAVVVPARFRSEQAPRQHHETAVATRISCDELAGETSPLREPEKEGPFGTDACVSSYVEGTRHAIQCRREPRLVVLERYIARARVPPSVGRLRGEILTP
jgi:hypothetical protein